VYEDCNVITDYCSAVRLPAEYKVEEVKQRYVPEIPELIAKQFRRANNKYEYETIKTLTKDELKAAGRFYKFTDTYAVDARLLRKLFDAVGGAVKVRIPTEDHHAPVYVLGKNGDGFLLPLRIVPQQ
jgi:hypothetical protein